MVSRKAMAALLVVHVAAMLASQTEAFVPFFTYSELQRMQLNAPVEIGMRMNSRQLEKYWSTLGGLLNEVLLSTQNETK